MDRKQKPQAVAYYRTSSATNVGQDKDSMERQKAAVLSAASRLGIELVDEYYDAAVSGADPVDTRPGFTAMMARLLSNGCRTIIVENASRFARDLMVQEVGYAALKAKGIELIAADSPDSFVTDTPTAVLIRQILGAVSQFDKATLVNKLRGARDRKSAKLGRRIEGNPNWRPVAAEVVQAAKAAHSKGMALRAVAKVLAARGMVAASGREYGPQSIKRMISR